MARSQHLGAGCDPYTRLRWQITPSSMRSICSQKSKIPSGDSFVDPNAMEVYLTRNWFNDLMRELRDLASSVPPLLPDPTDTSYVGKTIAKHCQTGSHHYRIVRNANGDVCVMICAINRDEDRNEEKVVLITTLRYPARSVIAQTFQGIPLPTKSENLSGELETPSRRLS